MKNPTMDYLSDFNKAKITLTLYFFICFLLNGAISVMLSVFYHRVIDPSIPLGSIGSNIPLEVLGFSQSYSLLVVGLASLGIFFGVNRKKIMEDLLNVFANIKKRPLSFLRSLIFFSAVVTVSIFATKLFGGRLFISGSFEHYLLEGIVNRWIIFIILGIFSFLEELVFRKIVMDALDERFLLNDATSFLIMAVISAFFQFLVFLDFRMIVPSLLFAIAMGFLYRMNNENFLIGAFFRIVFLTGFLLIGY